MEFCTITRLYFFEEVVKRCLFKWPWFAWAMKCSIFKIFNGLYGCCQRSSVGRATDL